MMLRVFKETFVGLNYRGRAEMSGDEMSIEMRRDRIATTILSNGERNFWAEIKGVRSNKVEVSRNISTVLRMLRISQNCSLLKIRNYMY
jgi:hypothetical protein